MRAVSFQELTTCVWPTHNFVQPACFTGHVCWGHCRSFHLPVGVDGGNGMECFGVKTGQALQGIACSATMLLLDRYVFLSSLGAPSTTPRGGYASHRGAAQSDGLWQCLRGHSCVDAARAARTARTAGAGRKPWPGSAVEDSSGALWASHLNLAQTRDSNDSLAAACNSREARAEALRQRQSDTG